MDRAQTALRPVIHPPALPPPPQDTGRSWVAFNKAGCTQGWGLVRRGELRIVPAHPVMVAQGGGGDPERVSGPEEVQTPSAGPRQVHL